MAREAGVPDNFFDAAKTKAFLNLNKAPQKSILKKGGGGASMAPPAQVNFIQKKNQRFGSVDSGTRHLFKSGSEFCSNPMFIWTKFLNGYR